MDFVEFYDGGMLLKAKVTKIFLLTLKEKLAGIDCIESSKIKMLQEFKVVNCWKHGKSD